MHHALQKRYESAAVEIARTVRETICMPCANPRKEKFKIDLNDPLNCLCRCDRVDGLLESAARILKGTG